MDPLTAIGLAGNLCQFVEFTSNLFSAAREISSSACGATEDMQDAAVIATSIKELLPHLAARSITTNPSALTPISTKLHAQILSLASGCSDAATELLEALQKLQAQAPKTQWSSFAVALKVIWNDRKIKKMQQRLGEYRQQVLFVLQLLESDQQSGLDAKFDSLKEASQENEELSRQIVASQSTIIRGLRELKLDMARQHQERQGQTLQSNLKPEAVAANVIEQARAGIEIGMSLGLLRTLRFRTMRNRYVTVPRAHEDTLQWMFDNRFSRWLESDHPMFWISGKPGSGKSTCMKFLVDNDQTVSHLKHWARGSHLVTAHYFFWINGGDLERSQEGLLRSLLYDILQQETGLIKHVFPERWRMLEQGVPEDDLSPWNLEELADGISRVFQTSTASTKFCLFIDGLDEYDGNHQDLVAVIKGLVSTDRVKLCIASRPWNVFEEAFGDEEMHKLYLENLNRLDIEAYVKSKLEGRSNFRAALAREPKMITICDEVVSMSSGVFLWVFLVVRSLIEGLSNRDRLVDLQRRLYSFPSDLNDFFRYMLTSVDDPYRMQTARVFQIALTAPGILSTLHYWYADLEEEDPAFWSKVPISCLSETELQTCQEDVRSRLNSRTKGLLEVTMAEHDGTEDGVDFLHRTVQDYMQTTDVQRMLNEWCTQRGRAVGHAQETFEPSRTICKATLAVIRSRFRMLDTVQPALPKDGPLLVYNFFVALNQYETRTNKTLPDIVRLLEQTAAEDGGKLDIISFAKSLGAHIWLEQREAGVGHTGTKSKVPGVRFSNFARSMKKKWL